MRGLSARTLRKVDRTLPLQKLGCGGQGGPLHHFTLLERPVQPEVCGASASCPQR